MTRQYEQTRVVYKQLYAAQLIKRGHQVIEILPNPRFPQNNMWLFEADDTFDNDLKEIMGGM